MFTFINLFFTTRFHLSNLVTRGSSNKLPRAQVSLDHELRGFSQGIYLCFYFPGVWGYSPTSQWGEWAGLAAGSPWGAVSVVWPLLCSCSAAHLLWGVQRDLPLWEVGTLCVSSQQGQAVRGAEVRLFTFLWIFVFHVYEHVLGLLSPCELIIQRSGMMVIPVQWIQWVCLNV